MSLWLVPRLHLQSGAFLSDFIANDLQLNEIVKTM